jgi:hypothetical protein
MKARVKDTGEVVDVRPCSEPLNVRLAFYETENGRKFPMFALEFETEIDWEQRRYEIAKELMRGFATNPHNMLVDAKIGTLAEWSVSGADALIAELKKGGME